MKINLGLLTILWCTSTTVFAQPAGAGGNTRDFAGVNFGIGFSLTSDLGSNSRVKSAVLDANNIVRISEEQNDIARVMLEAHYFFTPQSTGPRIFGSPASNTWGHGPFISLQPGTDEIIEAIGFGWMVGFRRSTTGSDSWNLGLGYVVDPTVQILGDGVIPNEMLPAGESSIRFKETSQDGVMLIVSFSF